jgi:NAD(P)H dehydrogenase (quinone)
MLSITTESPQHAYTPYGMDGDIHEKILYHINHGMLYFADQESVKPFIAWAPARDEEARKRYLLEYQKRLQNLSEIPSFSSYHPSSHYDDNHQLKIEYR